MTRKWASHTAFPARLRAQMRARGWSAADLAAQVGVRPPSVAYWTGGRSAPLDPQVVAIAEALALDPAEVWAVLARDGVTPIGGPAKPRAARAAAPVARPADRPFARWLRSELAARGWSGARLARLLNVDPDTVRKWASGYCPPASVHVRWLADALDVDPATIRELINRADSEDSTQH